MKAFFILLGLASGLFGSFLMLFVAGAASMSAAGILQKNPGLSESQVFFKELVSSLGFWLCVIVLISSLLILWLGLTWDNDESLEDQKKPAVKPLA